MKNILLISFSILLIFACVGPEDLNDGLVDNIPTVVNTNEAFTFALKADNYTFNESYSLSFSVIDSSSFISTTLLITGAGNSDSLSITFYGENNVELWPINWGGNMVYVSRDSTALFNPKSVQFKGEDYTGEIQCVLAVDK
ncbi:MAG: hypothetical protein HQ509_01995 [Candidatus Marinimicrobia bacterium]|nr:hypothetical protein [Candidatus Neomarinimicrobiota bacterium]